MFCRFCGAGLLDDSVFCAKCGRRLGRRGNPRLEKLSRILHLRTPYPYSALVILLVVIWAFSPHAAPINYTTLKWTLEVNRKLDLPKDNLFQQGFSLILENTGNQPVREIPVEFRARIEPSQAADINATFLGNRFSIMKAGKADPLIVVLSDEVPPGTKHSFLIEGGIQAQPPFRVTYEVREEDSETVLANIVVER